MKWVLGTCVLVMVVWGAVAPLLLRWPKVKANYARMDDRKLVEANTGARRTKRLLMLTGMLAPIGLLPAFLVFWGSPATMMPILVASGLVLVSCLVGARFHDEVESITTAEMDFRKFNSEKNELRSIPRERGGHPDDLPAQPSHAADGPAGHVRCGATAHWAVSGWGAPNLTRRR